MQINRTGYLLLAVFGLGGIVLIAAGIAFPAAGVGTIPTGAIWLLVTAGLALYALRSAERGRLDQELFRSGIRGTGTLVSARTGMVINEQPRMSLVLDLEVPGQAPRRVERNLIVSNFAAHRLRPGVVLPVYVNPADEDDILVVW